jgi:2-dehydropantoate 2-reductase
VTDVAPPRLLVVGAGATGGYFGARLAQAGRNVTFLVRDRRAAELRQHGLLVVSPHYGDVTLEPRLVTPGKIDDIYDFIILSVKAYQLDAAIEDVSPAVGPQTVILPVLNGMRHIEILAKRFSDWNIVGGALRVATTLDEGGRIVQTLPLQDFIYGELDGGNTPRIQLLHQFMSNAGFNTRLSFDVRREMWEKWILLAAGGAITCLMRGSIGSIESVSGGVNFSLAVLDEIVSVVRALDVEPSAESLANAKRFLTEKGSNWASSMCRDLLQGYPIEADQIIGDLIRRAQDVKTPTPLLDVAYLHLLVYQRGIEQL